MNFLAQKAGLIPSLLTVISTDLFLNKMIKNQQVLKKGFSILVSLAFVISVCVLKTNVAHAEGMDADIDFSWLGVAEEAAGDSSFTDVESLLGPAVNIFLGLAMSASAIAIIVSGTKYTMAKGDVKATAEARQSLTYAIFAFILSVGAFTLMKIILNLVGANNAEIYLQDRI